MNHIPGRMVIHTKDIENITGRRRRTAQAILEKIRKYHNKQKNDVVTVEEFCAFMKLKVELVKEFLVN